MEFAIIDIETTGGSSIYNSIVEIAVVIHDGVHEIERFQSLVNPLKHIPYNVSLIHGITDEMVVDAPTFAEIAPEIIRLTENRVFVAHSVNFDFSFVRLELQRIGIEFNRKKLCTVRLSRELIAGYKSYSLGNICSCLGISIQNRHRAMGDCEATALLFAHLFALDVDKTIFKRFMNVRSKETSLPPHLDRNSYDTLPMLTGVYFFHDHHGKVIYVGKAKNIKDRVNSHFTGNTHTKSRQNFHNSIYGVSCELAGNEFLALLVENEAIKKYYPKYNRSNKSFELNYGLYLYENQNGFMRLILGKSGKRDRPIATYKTNLEAIENLVKLTMQHGLCLKLNGMMLDSTLLCAYTTENGSICRVCQEGISADQYQQFVYKALAQIENKQSFIIKTKGRKQSEDGFVMVENGKFLGYGYVAKDENLYSLDELKNYLTPCYDTQDSQRIIQSYLAKATLVAKEPMNIYSVC